MLVMQEDPDGEHQENVLATGMVANSRPRDNMTNYDLTGRCAPWPLPSSDRLRSLAGELVAIKPDLIFALGGDVAPSARVATSTIPIVVAVSNDPVQAASEVRS